MSTRHINPEGLHRSPALSPADDEQQADERPRGASNSDRE
jgi:hypothetical protein